MKLKFIEIQLERPLDLDIKNFRSWLLTQIKPYGEFLRWSITSLEKNFIKIEGIIINKE